MIPNCKENIKVLEESVKDSYVRLFTASVKNMWKSCNILFYLTDTQNGVISQLCNLTICRKDTGVYVRTFKGVRFGADISTSLVAVITSTNDVEIFYKMGAAQSPTLQILSEAKMKSGDAWGKVEIDMNFVTATLPERYNGVCFKYIK